MTATERWARRAKGRARSLAGLAFTLTVAVAVSACWPQTTLAAATPTYAALGDSYSAGEGVGSYAYGTGSGNNHCDRSSFAYGPLLNQDRLKQALEFDACSGAITSDLIAPNHEGNQNLSTNQPEPAQFDALNASTATITFTIGGNDVGFAELGEQCFFARFSIKQVWGKAGCSQNAGLVKKIHRRIAALSGQGSATTPGKVKIRSILSLLLAAHQKAPSATIYVAGYPRLFGVFSGECGVGSVQAHNVPVLGTATGAVKLAAADAAWLDTVTEEIDTALANAASNASTLTGASIVYVNPDPEFETHRLCDSSNTWINEVSGTVDFKTKKKADLFPGSFHPTATGQQDGYEAAFLAAQPPAGSILVDQKSTGYFERYTGLASATNSAISETDGIPTVISLAPYQCVVLSLNEAPLSEAEVSALATYLEGGGKVLATGDYAPGWEAANIVMNQLASELGASIELNGVTLTNSDITSNIEESLLTSGVTSLWYAATNSLTVKAPATILARTDATDGEVPMVAAQAIGSGYLVMLGDSDILSDDTGGAEKADNAQFGRNLCNVAMLEAPRTAVRRATAMRVAGHLKRFRPATRPHGLIPSGVE